jgi:N-acetylglucosamine-6-sulfatase
MSKSLLRIAALLLLCAGFTGSVARAPHSQTQTAQAQERPNVLLIVTDDQRWDTMEYMPRTKARIFDQGVSFSNAFATTPLCCPSRASIFTGMYAGHHGVELNTDKLTEDKTTFAQQMHDSGYYTGLVGIKYLNTWDPRSPRPEFDFWSVGYYTDPERDVASLNVNGDSVEVGGYRTYVYGDYAQRFLEESSEQTNPFMLIYAPNAPHIPAVPAPGDETLYPDMPLHRPPSFNEADVSDKPTWVRATRSLSPSIIKSIDDTRLGQIQMLNSLDITIDDMLTTLEQQQKLDNTVVVFMSDNGYLWGEHRLQTKYRPYEESIRIPMAVRFPTAIPATRVDERIVANIDVAPTMYELAGLPIPSFVDGRSLLPLLREDPGLVWRDDILLEAREFSYNAVHTRDFVYIENGGDIGELYDLRTDPYQLNNEIRNAAYDEIELDMRARLNRLKPYAVRSQTRLINDASYTVKYASWVGVNDDNALTEGMRSSSAAGASIRYRTPATTDLGLIFYRGPNQGKAKIQVDGNAGEMVDLYAPTPEYGFRVDMTGLASLPHDLAITVLADTNPASTGTAVTFDALVVNDGVIEDWQAGINYHGWAASTDSHAYLGNYFRSTRRGVGASFTSIGTHATWITARGPSYGIADIFVDGVLTKTVDLYSPTVEWQYRVSIAGIYFGRHTVTIKATGTRNQNATGTAIVFDGYSFP